MGISAAESIYLIQVVTGKERIFVQHVDNLFGNDRAFQLIVPSRQLTHRRMGKLHPVVKPIFPGYIFLTCGSIHPDTRNRLKRIPGFIRYMKDENGNLIPLCEQDRQLLQRLIATGETSPRSIVTFNKNNRVVPLSGPLKSCEGKIIKVDRRKRRAKVKFILQDKTFLIDFEYEELQRQEPGEST